MPLKSENTGEIAKALSAAQKAMKSVSKDSKGNFGHYASLAAVRETCNEALSAQGIAYVQSFGRDGDGDYLETTFYHTSGQWISSKMYLRTDKQTMQGLGSATTYARRYSLAALAGLAQDDDDGQSAESEQLLHRSSSSRTPPKVFVAPKPEADVDPAVKQLLDEAKKLNWDKPKLMDWLNSWGFDKIKDIDPLMVPTMLKAMKVGLEKEADLSGIPF